MTSIGTRAWAAVVVATLLLMAGCGTKEAVDQPDDRASIPSSVTGVITDIDSEAIDEVRSFTLKDGDNVYEVNIADDVEYGFPLGHLNAHMTGAEPVTVELEDRDGTLVALSIEDA
ncbi:MAG TPA: hypothetical protein VNC78_11875 [Actinomycetota bacterium]|nr:hypothetical protein [Actinomycetota bacterium]